MSSAFPSIKVLEKPVTVIVRPYKEEISVHDNTTLTNQQAIRKIVEYLDNATAYLKDKRLAIK